MAEELAPSTPPESFEPVETWVLDGADQLSALRAELHRALTGNPEASGQGLGSVPQKLVLVASELATNALRHGLPPTTVTLLAAEEEFLLDVADYDVDTPPVTDRDRPAGEGGLGMQLAEHLSVDVGWYTTPETKHVWARFPASDAGTDDGLMPGQSIA